jgi:hypothetical protein
MTTKIVDVLREWKKVDTEYSAVFALMKDLEVAKWDDDMRDIYLRGYDDAKKEMVEDGAGGRDTYEVLWSAIDKMGHVVGVYTGPSSSCYEIADAVVVKIDALTAERDAARERSKYWKAEHAAANEVIDTLRADRDRLAACVERVRGMEGQSLDDDVYDLSGGWVHVESLRRILAELE